MIQNLPTSIDTESVRISGLGNVRLADVVCTNTVRNGVLISNQSEALRALLQRKSSIESHRRVHEYEAELLVLYGKTLHGDHVHPKDFEAFLSSFVEQGKKSLTSFNEYTAQILRLEKEIDEQIKKDNEGFDTGIKQGGQDGRVEVILSSQADNKNLELQVTYSKFVSKVFFLGLSIPSVVSKVIWEPTYELHAITDNTSGKPSSALTLHYRARITQSTGEDWNTTRLTLSTVSVDSLFKSIPRVRPLKVRPALRFPGRGPNTQIQATTSMFGQTQGAAFVPNNTSSNLGTQLQQASMFGQPQGAAFVPNNTSSHLGTQLQQAQAQQFRSQPATFAQPAQANALPPPNPFKPQSQSNTGLFGFAPASNTFGAQSQPSGGTISATSTTRPQEADQIHEEFEVIVPLSSGGFAGDVASTVVTETPLAISFVVDGESTIPSDGLPHQAEIAKLDFEGKIEHVVVPRTDATVYLQVCVAMVHLSS